jgi:FkbM family methyltransferase
MRHIPKLRQFWQSLPFGFTGKGATARADRSDVGACYRLLLGREPGPSDWSLYGPILQRGLTRRALVDGFMASDEFHRRFNKPPEFVDTKFGFGIYVDIHDQYIGSAILEQHVYEPHVTATLQRELHSDHVFLDVGANVGWFSLLAARILRNGKVVAVEPNPRNVQLIYASLSRNELHNVFVYPFAATETNQMFDMEAVGSNGFVTSSIGSSLSRTYVQGVSLGMLLEPEPRLDVIKMDIEGHELLAMRGMGALLTRHHPIILTEFHPKAMQDNFQLDPEEYLSELANHGYQMSIIELSGDETTPMASKEILHYWRRLNKRLGLVDEVHVDLICRPA